MQNCRGLSVAAACIVAMTACGSGSEAPSSEAATTSATVETAGFETAGAPVGEAVRTELREAVSAGHLVPTAASASSPGADGVAAPTDSEVTECMRDRGFENYTVADDARRWDGLSQEEFRAQYGFGILPLIELQAYSPDPNVTIAADLDSGDLTAYTEAQAVCDPVGAPQMEVVTLSDEAWAALNDLRNEIVTSPEMIQAEAAWAECVAERGSPIANRSEMMEQIGRRSERFAAPFLEQLNTHQMSGDHDAAAALRMVDVLSPAEHAEYEAAVEREIEAAQLDAQCGPLVDDVHDRLWAEGVQDLVEDA